MKKFSELQENSERIKLRIKIEIDLIRKKHIYQKIKIINK